jgi:FMN phosphatase YigB (HAD superfamily)
LKGPASIAGLKQFVDFVVTSEDAKSSKPEAKIFDHAAQKAGRNFAQNSAI